MAGLGPAIHAVAAIIPAAKIIALMRSLPERTGVLVDSRDKPGHDAFRSANR
jgi:hypothetical protein